MIVGNIYTTNFKRFDLLIEEVPDAMYLAVTRYPMYKRGTGRSAELRRDIISWFRDLAPSRELLRRVRSGKIDWTEFSTCYLTEMDAEEPQKLLTELAHCVAAGRTIVLMCFEQAGERCHRTLLRELLFTKVKRLLPNGNSLPNSGELCRTFPATRVGSG